MPIGKNKTIIQVIVHKDVKSFIDKYSKIFHLSVSEFCNIAICDKVLKLINTELEIENQKSKSID